MAKSRKRKNSRRRSEIGILGYIIAGLSFIPLCGVPFGIAAIIWGFLKIERGGKRIMIMGVGGILVTIVLYGSLFYFGYIQRGGGYDELRVRMAEVQLSELVKSIEFYKLQEGRYPNSLIELQKEGSDQMAFIYDSTDVSGPNASRLFHYELDSSGEYYYLFSVGIDGQPYTEDDIYPKISDEQNKNLGYRVKER